RQALNDDSENPRFVETLYRRGYRFIGPVNGPTAANVNQVELEQTPASVPPASVPIQTSFPASTPNRRYIVYCAIALLLILAVMVAYRLIPTEPPRVLGFTQLTHDGFPKFSIFSDGQRLYFGEMQGDHPVLSQVS